MHQALLVGLGILVMGGGNTITTNPTAVNTYTAPGTYDVSLIVTNAVGCGDTALIQALVTVEGPVVTFTASK